MVRKSLCRFPPRSFDAPHKDAGFRASPRFLRVIRAKAGIQCLRCAKALDSSFRWNDGQKGVAGLNGRSVLRLTSEQSMTSAARVSMHPDRRCLAPIVMCMVAPSSSGRPTVIPAKAGIQCLRYAKALDSSFRWNDEQRSVVGLNGRSVPRLTSEQSMTSAAHVSMHPDRHCSAPIVMCMVAPPSSQRKLGSSAFGAQRRWIPAFAGMTGKKAWLDSTDEASFDLPRSNQ